MITREEAVKKIAREGIEHAEDLYDEIIPKPVVPQYVADWYEDIKEDFENKLFGYIRNFHIYNSRGESKDFNFWFDDNENAIKTLINMHQFGYEVKKEKRYTVRIRNLNVKNRFLVYGNFGVSIPYLLGYDTLTDLIAKINEWADERNLKQADPKIQWMRVTEEVGEIRDVLLKPTKFTDPQMALKDAIGDTLVTIIVLAHQLDLDVTECLGIAYEEIKNRKGKMVNGTFVKEEDL